MQHHYKLRSSRLLALSVTSLGIAALVSLWLLPLPASVLFVLTILVLCWAGYRLLIDAKLQLARSCVAFRLEDQEGIVLVLRSGKHLAGKMLSDSLVTPIIVILNVVLNEQRGTRSLLIFPDAMSEDSFRRLRVELRWGDRADQAASI